MRALWRNSISSSYPGEDEIEAGRSWACVAGRWLEDVEEESNSRMCTRGGRGGSIGSNQKMSELKKPKKHKKFCEKVLKNDFYIVKSWISSVNIDKLKEWRTVKCCQICHLLKKKMWIVLNVVFVCLFLQFLLFLWMLCKLKLAGIDSWKLLL